MAQPILTLTTDFGVSDHYVGAMKGVILSICPRAQIVDICHEVTPFAIAEGAYVIAQAYECFPRKTVHVVVVDPGVGTARSPILVEAAGQFFVGPDNGVLSMLYARQMHRVRLIANDRYFRQPVSATFHGRDIFAPVAAHLAAGVAPARIGGVIQDYQAPDFLQPQRSGERIWSGRVLKTDRFGNIVTNFAAADFPGACSVTIGRRKIATRVRTYAEGPAGKLLLIVGSSGYLEVSINQGSAASQIGCRSGTPATLILG
jgi:S-adenosyl-L-methionine hydrolase (adenosine-forming)